MACSGSPPTASQLCQGDLIRFRTTTGICNDIRNPAMGSAGQLFTRNVDFESTHPELGLDPLAKNRHGDRIALLEPDPQVISRRLFTRDQTRTPGCNHGKGTPGSTDADCDYRKAPFFNVLAAFWIQFMTHDWFAHPEDARNDQAKIMASLGCATEHSGDAVVPLTPERAAELGCRPEDTMEAGARRRRCARAGRSTRRAARASPAPRRPAGTSSPRGGTPPRSTASTNARRGG